jgi:hypothetical protein
MGIKGRHSILSVGSKKPSGSGVNYLNCFTMIKFLKSIWTFIDDRLEFVVDNSKDTPGTPLRNIKLSRVCMLLGALVLLQLWSLVSTAQYDMLDGTGGVVLHVNSTGAFASKHRHHYQNDSVAYKSHFISGMEGELYWKPKTLTESILLNSFSGKNSTEDIIDIASYANLSIVFIFIIKGSAKSTYFDKNIITKFLVAILIISTWSVVVDMIKFSLAQRYIMYITHGQFSAYYTHAYPLKGLYIYILLSLLAVFPRKALELQQEQELTI